MAVNLVTYPGSTFTALDMALVDEAALGEGGVFYGAGVTASGANVQVAAGDGIICGRKWTITAQETLPITLPSSGTRQGRVYLHMDLSNTSAPIELRTQVAATLTDPVQDPDVNETGGVYEINLATFTVAASGISGITYVARRLNPGAPDWLAAYEASYTTTRAYSAGEYVTVHGKLYRITAAISNGGTIRPGSNAAETILGDILQTTDSKLPFALAISGGQYGYLTTGGAFVPFKSASGNATAAQVLAGRTFSNASGSGLTGTMPNRGAVTLTPTGSGSVSGGEGYYSSVKASGARAYAAGQAAGNGTYNVQISSNINASSPYGAQVFGAISGTVVIKITNGVPSVSVNNLVHTARNPQDNTNASGTPTVRVTTA